MPGRAPTRDTGFGGFAEVPHFRTSDGRRVPQSYVDQASDATIFGTGTVRGTSPRTAPTFNAPTRTTPPVPDAGGAGLTPSGLGGNTLRSYPNTPWKPDIEATPAIPSGGGRSPAFTSDPNLDWTGTNTRDSGLWHGPDREQISSDDLYRDETEYIPSPPEGPTLPSTIYESDPTAQTGPSLTVDPGVNSRPPTNPGYMANFGGNMTLGQFLSTPLAFLRFGENRGYTAPVSGGNVTVGAGANRTTDYTPGTGGGASGNAEADLANLKANESPELAGIPEADMSEAQTSTAPTSDPTNPASRFGNLNSPGGQAVYFDGQNWRPVSGAPSNIRWDPLSGTGNAVASSTTEGYVAGGGDPGRPNDLGSFASEGRFLLNEEGAPTMQGRMYGDRQGEFRMGQKSGAPVGNTLAYNKWLRNQPEYKAWLKSRGG